MRLPNIPTMVELGAVRDEVRRADAKHGVNGIAQLRADDPRWLPILVEEVGEAAAELTYDRSAAEDPSEALRAELLQVAAVALAWVAAIRRPDDTRRLHVNLVMHAILRCRRCGEDTVHERQGTAEVCHRCGITWVPPRPSTPPVLLPDGGKRITVQRCCNGCGRSLGDVTDAEIETAMYGQRLPDVRDECGCAHG